MSQSVLDSFNMEETPQEVEKVDPPKKPMSGKEKREFNKFSKMLMYGLQAPMVFSAGGWGEDFPKDKIEMASILRLASCSKCFDEEMSTKYDAMCYLNTASMEAPFTHQWYKIYMHTFREAAPDMWKTLIEGDKWIERDAELEQNEVESLNRLRRWIFKCQLRNLK